MCTVMCASHHRLGVGGLRQAEAEPKELAIEQRMWAKGRECMDPQRMFHVKLALFPPRGGWRGLAGGHHLRFQPPVPLHTLQPPQPVRPD